MLLMMIIMAVGAALRLIGLNWDGGQWLHPDERQIYFTTLALAWPSSLAEALHPNSPLNPHFFAYGSLPIYLLKVCAAMLAPLSSTLGDPGNLHLVGRPLVALFDLGTLYLTYRLACTLWPEQDAGRRQATHHKAILAAALFGLAALPMQLAHFYTADTLLAFFVMLTLTLAAGVARGQGRPYQAALGIALGLALSTKISALPLVLVALLAHTLSASTQMGWAAAGRPAVAARWRRWFPPVRRAVVTLALALVTFVTVQPYALIDWPAFVADTLRESQIAWGTLDVPYTRQYAGSVPYLYPIWQSALWGLGLPSGLVGWAGAGAAVVRWLRHGHWTDSLLLAWAGPYLAITGALHAHPLRYMLPLMPVLCLVAVRLVASIRPARLRLIAHGLLVLSTAAYAALLVSVYFSPHPWIQASAWIYTKAPVGSTLAVEEWDTALPLPLEIEGRARRIAEYDLRTLALYAEPDNAAKWEQLAADLAASDYLLLASRRLYGSIPRLPERYPIATRYYERLLAGELGFEVIQEFGRGPAWLNPRCWPLPGAIPALLCPDESWAVYDRPRTLILRNTERLPAPELIRRLQ